MPISLTEAKQAVEAAIRKAEELDVLISVAVCDEGGHLLAFSRMDGAGWAGVYGAQGKAVASAATGAPSGRIPPDLTVMRRINELAGDRMIYAQGAAPIRLEGRVVGAIGTGGASAEQDEICALAGADAIMKTHG
ncbi:GlcG/HbpS family heme-binding protein [Hyphococcus sp.]|uniref:GlcG/HbpS family heme-binding protein n=1 Tax=Hyphococcus sp. TaxID=2038636 RepID=UPI003CCBBCC1